MVTLRLRLVFDDAMLGPGKADLLRHIQATGSIAAAGRQMDMSYKRAWMLVEEMNAAFRDPLVTSMRGGPGGGGAQLTKAGVRVLGLYHEVVQTAATAAAAAAAAAEAEHEAAMAADRMAAEEAATAASELPQADAPTDAKTEGGEA